MQIDLTSNARSKMPSSFVLFATFIMSQVITCFGHVGLYYPPARTYPLDFLDSARTVPPCGMAAGQGPVTDLLAGSTINVSWYLGYAHSGGFRIELLRYDTSGSTYATTNLTAATSPDGFISMNVTTTSYMVTLPNNTCNNCTIRLIRQALNWGPSYLFWSCADVNIIPASRYTPSCGGHGTYSPASSSCQCSGAFSGSSCEFSDDCIVDTDCGSNGKCLKITGYSYPQKQCFCQPGWFGVRCERVSSLTTVQFNQLLYNNITFVSTTNVTMYYRILNDSNELEIVLQGRTKSYLGLGWKSINKVCVPFSLRFSSTVNGSSQPQPEGSISPSAEGTPKSEPKAEPPQSKPEPNVEPSPEQPSSEPGAAEPETTGSSDLNGMDCTDIVIGAAVGSLSRIGDYYTGDRSTPRRDEFYGGTQTSLTAAVGFESSDGVTTIVFRKKLTANELTDNSVTNDLMTVIWAHGQAPGDSPATGDFYRQDEIKYHATHRGMKSLNFYEPSSSQVPNGNSVDGSGSWAYPTGCSGPGTCLYKITWSLDSKTDVLSFNIVANQSQSHWTAVAFAKQQKMENMDVYVGYVDTGNRASAFDGWTGVAYTTPIPDKQQNIQSASVSYVSGLLSFSFQRPRQTNDVYDWSFTNTDCYYFFFPIMGGPVSSSNAIGIHDAVPMVSSNKICITSPTGMVPPGQKSMAISDHVITTILQKIALITAVIYVGLMAH